MHDEMIKTVLRMLQDLTGYIFCNNVIKFPKFITEEPIFLKDPHIP